MIGIDTNILERYITQDGKETPAATELLEKNAQMKHKDLYA